MEVKDKVKAILAAIKNQPKWLYLYLSLITVALFLIAFALIALKGGKLSFNFSDQIQNKFFPSLKSPAPAVWKTNSGIKNSEAEGKIDLFRVKLEYNPVSGLVTQQEAKKNRGRIPLPLVPQLRKEDFSSSTFAYKIEVWNARQQVTFSGWAVDFKKLITTDKGLLDLEIMVPYQGQSFLRVYLPGNKLIWIGKME